MINTLQNDQFVQFLMQGQKEVIIAAQMFGAPWKAKLDIYNPERGRIVDLKTVQDLYAKFWDKELGIYVNFVEAYGYVRQMALYAEIERIAKGRDKWLEPLIIAVTKHDVPDKDIIGFDDVALQEELEKVAVQMERILSVKNGAVDPRRCEKCIHCRRTKKLRSIRHYSELLV
jgi:hypothetical protein